MHSHFAHADHLGTESIVMFSSGQNGSGIHAQATELAEAYTERLNTRGPSHGHGLGLVLSASGSCSNVKHLIDSRFEFGVVRADVAEAIFQNPKKFNFDLRVDHLRLVGKLAPSYVHIIARNAGDTPRALAELAGSRMGVGLPDQLVSLSVASIFESHGLPLSSVQLSHHPMDDSISRLKAGQVDALVIIDQLPSSRLDALLADSHFELVSLDEAILQQHLSDKNNARHHLLAKRLVTEPDREVVMLAIDTFLLARNTVSPTTIEPLASYFREASTLTGSADPAASPATPSSMSSIPLHEAIRQSALRTGETASNLLDQ